MFNLRDAPKIQAFDFNKMHEGRVVDTSRFECEGIIYVTLPELFIGTDDERIISYMDHLNTSSITNALDLKFETAIHHVNYIECRPLVFNGFSFGSLLPDVGDRVLVQFLNGDAKLPYYINAYPLKDKEPIPETSADDGYTGFGYYRIIKLKSKAMVGPDVHKVGTKLKVLGYNVAEDSESGSFRYDENMYEAVKAFQKRVGITQDGLVGPITFRMLMQFKKNRVDPSINSGGRFNE